MPSCTTARKTVFDQLVEYEAGTLDPNETIEMFQELIDIGLAWTLPGDFGRGAIGLIRVGLCRPGAPLPESVNLVDQPAEYDTPGQEDSRSECLP